MAYEALEAGCSLSYISAEYSSEALCRQMASIGRKVSRFLRSGRLRIQTLEKPTAENASSTLIQTIADHYGPGQVVIVDSATDYLR